MVCQYKMSFVPQVGSELGQVRAVAGQVDTGGGHDNAAAIQPLGSRSSNRGERW